jgi:hypothetical protein
MPYEKKISKAADKFDWFHNLYVRLKRMGIVR